jgi:hypothetical protein
MLCHRCILANGSKEFEDAREHDHNGAIEGDTGCR